ncbi:uncharacterized protein LOC9652042 [Selaginella moellendorffii]|uniref:uncharacterized protein LOC9652042 n=1 Tax=Selaginella moellendorffii TaxID=88036 RepID=UPI000D1CA0C5|nr:uncharacterized protein LOC9652042 [Selaginella moellendorffii]|eukprot:XP_024526031.1 uncharacterized protein LOC9652042 [Selaginella moellendorffii]
MSAAIGVPLLEAIYCLGCTRWAYKRCIYIGADDSSSWTAAEAHELEPIPRVCQLVLAVYERDLQHPKWAPPGGYKISLENVVKKTSDLERIVPPYLIYVDHEHRDIVLTIRGLNLRRENDYLVLWDNKLGRQEFLDGYVHHGLLRAAVWLLYQEKETLRNCITKHPTYTLTFGGHSLGSGVAALMAVLAIQFPFLLADIPRKQIRCYAIAPARCMSLNLAVKYADVINSIILQDDFLPRTATPLEDIFKSMFCLPCLLGYRCLKDTCISEEKLLHDPRRLYAPGRMYHIVERKFCSCWKHPPVVKSGIPVEGRFEHIVLSCNAISDHSILAIMEESEKALQMLRDKDTETNTPPIQKMTRQQTRAKEQDQEHKAALRRAATLEVPSAGYESADETQANGNGDCGVCPDDEAAGEVCPQPEAPCEAGQLKLKIEWDELLDKLFRKDDAGKFVWNK